LTDTPQSERLRLLIDTGISLSSELSLDARAEELEDVRRIALPRRPEAKRLTTAEDHVDDVGTHAAILVRRARGVIGESPLRETKHDLDRGAAPGLRTQRQCTVDRLCA
jgi:hypothetical protein